MQAVGQFLAKFVLILNIFAGVVLFLMMLHISADVIGRYFFNYPLPGTITIVSKYYMVVATFIPLAMCQKRDMHISVEVVMQLFPEPVQRHAYNLARIYSVVIFALLTYTSWNQAETRRAAGSFAMELGFKVPIWPGYYLLPIGLGMITLVLLYQLAIYFTGARNGLGDTHPWSSRKDDQLEVI